MRSTWLASAQRRHFGGGGPEPEFEGQEHAQDSNLGVDASEISEHHLQAALSSNQLATSEANAEAAKAAYSIPVPDAHGTLSNAEFAQLYPSGVYSDPVTYIRFSETVEDCIKGPSYDMDEDDQDWLDTRNAKAQETLTAAIRSAKTGPLASSGAKGKGKEKLREEAIEKLVAENQGSYRLLSEDQFEMIMTVFEQVTNEQVPFLHLDVTKIPTCEELVAYFEPSSSISAQAQPDLPELSWEKTVPSSNSGSSSGSSSQARRPSVAASRSNASPSSPTEWSPSNPFKNLADLKNLATIVYPHWKSRREDREGRSVAPILNFDETNDNDPYVCFRRREVKQIRKTRKTDALHIEKMVRLRAELEHAVALTELVAQREKTKRASLRQSRECWENVKDLMDIKRQWGIVGPQQGLEDEELISGERRDPTQAASGPAKKKRKADEAAATIKLAGRKSRTGEGDGASATASAAGVSGMGSAILERVHAVQAYIERECLRKADSDLGWEEGSDAAFQPIPAPAPLRAFRPIHTESSDDPLPFSPLSTRAGRPPSFRRRLGRGGRVFLDRRLPVPSPVPTNLADWPRYGRTRSELPGTESRSSTTARSADTLSMPEASPAQSTSPSKTLMGPFAFSPDVHPQLLASASHPSVQSVLNQSTDAFGGPFARSGPFAGPASTSDSHDETPGSQHSDASSTSSVSSDRSRLSGTSVGVVSTQATEVGDIDMLGLDEEHEKESEERAGASGDSDSSEDELSDPERELQRWVKMEERWRYDDEAGRFAGLGLTALGGMEEDDEAVLDDFDQKFMRYRMTLLEEADLLKLSTDLTNLQQAQAAAEAPPRSPQAMWSNQHRQRHLLP